MKKLLLLFLVCFTSGFLQAQATNSATFTVQGKTYTANYNSEKHKLVFSEEVSYEIYDQSGECVKRGVGESAEFSSLLKGKEEQTFTVRLYKKAKKKGKKIKQKGPIGTMIVTDSKL
jgi:hypothetical protein